MTLDYEIVLSRHCHSATLTMKGKTRPIRARMYRIVAALFSDDRLAEAHIEAFDSALDPCGIVVRPYHTMSLENTRDLIREIADDTK